MQSELFMRKKVRGCFLLPFFSLWCNMIVQETKANIRENELSAN